MSGANGQSAGSNNGNSGQFGWNGSGGQISSGLNTVSGNSGSNGFGTFGFNANKANENGNIDGNLGSGSSWSLSSSNSNSNSHGNAQINGIGQTNGQIGGNNQAPSPCSYVLGLLQRNYPQLYAGYQQSLRPPKISRQYLPPRRLSLRGDENLVNGDMSDY